MSKVIIEIVPTGGKFHVMVNGSCIHKAGNMAAAMITVEREKKKFPDATLIQDGIHVGDGSGEAPIEEFDINQRFTFLTKMVKMVGKGSSKALIVVGQGGLGKTHSVKEGLALAGLEDRDELVAHSPAGASINTEGTYTMIKGYSTAKGLYRLLYEKNGSVLVFDDCDSIQKDQNALNILKGALDSHDKRIISWRAEIKGDDDLPQSFEFTGRIIFISNMRMSVWDDAVKSRCMTVDVHMNRAQIVERLRAIVANPDFMPDYEMAHKEGAMDIVDRHRDVVKSLNFRTLIKATQAYAECDVEDAEDMVTYLITNDSGR